MDTGNTRSSDQKDTGSAQPVICPVEDQKDTRLMSLLRSIRLITDLYCRI